MSDFGYLALLYISLLCIRLVMIVLSFPVLSRMGYGLTWKDALVLVWGGLRGAVGLALALIIDLDDTIPSAESTRIMFMTAGIATFT